MNILMSGQRGRAHRQIMGLLLAFLMLFSMLPGVTLAARGTGAVYVGAENTTYAEGDGAAWGGALLGQRPAGMDEDAALAEEGEASNAPPALRSGVPAAIALEINWGDAYTINLEEIFEDPDGDPLTYTVKIDDAEPVAADADYSYTPAAAGSTTLVFAADDGEAASADNYTVTLTCHMEGNLPPVLKSGVPAQAVAEINWGDAYTINLEEIFEDPDGDPLTYTVKIDDAEPVTADAGYSYTPAAAGSTALIFAASDGVAKSESHTVTLTAAGKMLMASLGSTLTFKVAPSTNQVTFYATTGFDSDGYDEYDSGSPLAAADNGVTGDYRVYTVQVPEQVSSISFRGTDAFNNPLGGMTVDLDDAVGGVITLRQAELYISTDLGGGVYPNAGQAKLIVKDADYRTATYGSTYVNNSRTRFRYLLYAGGNAELYTYYAVPQGPLAETYATGVAQQKTITTDYATIWIDFMSLPPKYIYTITAPTGATVQMFNQIRNFYAEEIDEAGHLDKGDGSTSHIYNLAGGNGSLTYRVSKSGQITKAGYLPILSGNDGITVDWSGADAPADTRINDVDSTTLAERLEESVLLNVNPQNCLKLDLGESFKLRAYRIWQIINNDTANIMIEPDFHYNVISGGHVVSINTVADGNGNAAGNWMDITALQKGVAVVEVSYDAIDISSINDSTSYSGVYAASDPRRTGLLVIQVGGAASGIDLGIGAWDLQGNWDAEGTWDAECDTVYFNGDTGALKLSPTVSGGGSISSVSVLNDPATNSTWTDLCAVDGVYTATITPGNNILRVASGDAAEYQIVRGAAVTTVINNVSDDTVEVSFEGLYMPMPKFSGIYNPGYNGGHYITYSLSAGITLESQEHQQYNFINQHALTLKLTGAAPYALTDGHIYFNMMGVPEPLGGHRKLTDYGVGANFYAYNTYHSHAILPDVIIGSDSPSVKRGDLNGDGDVNSMDATILAKYLVNLTALSGDRLTAADVNGDGDVNSMDATILAKYLVNLIPHL